MSPTAAWYQKLIPFGIAKKSIISAFFLDIIYNYKLPLGSDKIILSDTIVKRG